MGTFGEMKTAVASRGLQYLVDGGTDEARLERAINTAYQWVCEQELWPFLRVSYTGTLPHLLSDLRQIDAIYTSALERPLEPSSREWLTRNVNTNLNSTDGAATWYFVVLGIVQVFPADASTSFTVDYFRVPDELDDDADSIIVPDRFESAVEDHAVFILSEDQETKTNAKAARDETISLMRRSLLGQQAITHQQMVYGHEDA